MGFCGSCHWRSHQTAWDCVKLKSQRGRAWMIYAFVISHLLKQGANIFVSWHQSSLQRQSGKVGANALEENSKVIQAICPGVPLFSSILLGRCNGSRQSPCDSYVKSLWPCRVISRCILVHCPTNRTVNATTTFREIISWWWAKIIYNIAICNIYSNLLCFLSLFCLMKFHYKKRWRGFLILCGMFGILCRARILRFGATYSEGTFLKYGVLILLLQVL